MWVIDIRHWLNDDQTEAAAPELRLKVIKLTEIITYITALESDLVVGDSPVCWRRPSHKPCKTPLHLSWTEDDRIYFKCPKCSNEGVIDGWHGLIWDVSVYDGEYVVH